MNHILKKLSLLLALMALCTFSSGKVFASDLVVTFPSSPLFTISNAAPGQTITKQFTIKNTTTSSITPAMKIKNLSQTKHLADVVFATILDGSVPLYGTSQSKTLSTFASDSQILFGVPLVPLSPQQQKTFTFTLLVDPSASNQFQAASSTFDITVGENIDIPAACTGISFQPHPIIGTAKNDIINGTPGNDLIFGLEGKDIIYGKGGTDCIVGGTGDDIIYGEAGNDFLYGQDGNDQLFGGDDQDVLQGGSGNNLLFGENGNDNLTTDSYMSILHGGQGFDICIGSIFKLQCEQ